MSIRNAQLQCAQCILQYIYIKSVRKFDDSIVYMK